MVVITATITILSPAMVANASSNAALLVEFIAMLLLLLASRAGGGGSFASVSQRSRNETKRFSYLENYKQ